MKLIVQIPAFNEEKSIVSVIKEIPRKIPGIQKVEILVIDDGSTDNTSQEAKKAGADYVIKNTKNSGLAYTFQKGLQKSLELGADIIVNTDADFQYNQKEIPKLIKPILDNQADIVSGNRQVEQLDHMIAAKKYGNMVGSKVVKFCAGYDIIDASSGFRAYSKQAAMKLFVTSTHTYTHDTLIQASHKNLKVIEVPVEFRKREGDSKLIKSVSSHIKKSLSTIMRTTLMYNSFRFFSYTGAILIILGLIPMIRWFVLSYLLSEGGQHIQSLIVGAVLIVAGGMSVLLGFVADLLAVNRRYLEEILYLNRKRLVDGAG
ncbi:MAG TPA: glycosyltransferase family 2 protein [Candidatus Nanoarchaeia archaeon]|nr:glycosyltransferase family 2 protein [Candidatus Nanoarchaeia archaeon]